MRSPIKIKDITESSGRWSTPSGSLQADAAVEDGVLVDLSLWGTSIIGLAVQCPDGKYFSSIRAPGPVYDHVLEFLKRNYGRKLREVMDAEGLTSPKMKTVDLERLKEKEDAAIKIIDSWPRIFQLLIHRQLYAFGTRISNIDSEIEKELKKSA